MAHSTSTRHSGRLQGLFYNSAIGASNPECPFPQELRFGTVPEAFTNDEELMVRMNNPQTGAARLYHIALGERVQSSHLEELKRGFVVDKGFVRAEEAEFANEERNQIGLKLVSSRSRIARRMLEQLGYHVIKVDRVTLGPLTKKDVPRGSFRHLSDAEINLLRMSC